MQCYQCDQAAEQECPRCGALYCDAHGDALCDRCMDPALALPSYRVYRGSLAALLIGSVFAIWLLVLPQAGADPDAPPSSLAGVLPTRTTATASPVVPTITATAAPPATVAAETPTATATAAPTATPAATPAATEAIRYTVQPGDTLYAIAERYLPTGRDLDQFKDQIQALNQELSAVTVKADGAEKEKEKEIEDDVDMYIAEPNDADPTKWLCPGCTAANAAAKTRRCRVCFLKRSFSGP